MTTTVQDQFSAAYSTAFDPPAVVDNEFSAAWSSAFDPPPWTPLRFTIAGTGFLTPGYRLALAGPGDDLTVVTTVLARTDTRIECTWVFTTPGTYAFVLVDTSGLIATSRLPVVVTT